MTDSVRYTTSHLHEFAAKIQQMSFEGYILDTRSAFAAKRLGSAYVCYFVPTRDVLDFIEIENAKDILDNPPAPNKKLKELLAEVRQDQNSHKEAVEKLKILVEHVKQNPDSDEAISLLTSQAQELDMGYEKQLTIQEKWEIDDEINFEADEKKKLAESEDCVKMVYTKPELDELYWTDLQEVGRKFGVKQRDRKKLTRMILEVQHKNEME